MFREVALRRSVRCFRRAESGAKVSTFFETTKSFRKIFFRNFSEPFSLRPRPSVLSEAGAKVSQISESPKISGLFFETFFRTSAPFSQGTEPELSEDLAKKKLHEYEPFCLPQEACFSLEAGAKIRLTKCYFQIFQRLFFDIFLRFFTPSYKSAS